MRNYLIPIIIVLSFVLQTSCTSDDECSPVTLDITSLEAEYACNNTAYEMDIDLTEEFTIIRSQAVFDALVTGTCMPQIDFEAYDLLIGKRGLSNGFDSITYDGLVKNCDTGQFNLTVTIVLNETTEAPNVTYHALIPKLSVNEIITVSIVTL